MGVAREAGPEESTAVRHPTRNERKVSCRHTSTTIAAAGGAAVAALLAVGLAAPPAHAEGTILGAGHPDAIAGSYLVALNQARISQDGISQDGISTQASDLAARYDGKLGHVYDAALTGFSIRLDEAAARRLAADSAVEYVEQDRWVEVDGTQHDPPTWGLDRIDEHQKALDDTYKYPNTASNVNIYVLDTGVRLSHDEFGGRAYTGWDAVNPGGSAQDCHGHGTHVAGAAAGEEYGVAKQARIYSVRVLGCDGRGSTSTVVAGVNWVTNNADKPAVANMSLGGEDSTSLKNAVSNSIASGITYVTSAGNDGADACDQSPANVSAALTVSASTINDRRSRGFFWSANIGPCVDLFAPGTDIYAADDASDTAILRRSGTSHAAPHVAGAAAMILSDHPTWNPYQVANRIYAVSTKNIVTDPGAGTPNRLLHTGAPPKLVSFVCESWFGQFTCWVSTRSTEPVTIQWLRNGSLVPGWENDASVSGACNSSTTIRAVVSNAHGAVSTPIWSNCRFGLPL